MHTQREEEGEKEGLAAGNTSPLISMEIGKMFGARLNKIRANNLKTQQIKKKIKLRIWKVQCVQS
jgi:hypothetical protein